MGHPAHVLRAGDARLTKNYATDAETKDFVDNLDIFIVPSVNPDGSHHSF